MSITLTEDIISQRLSEAIQSAGPSSDGYAELELNDEITLKCAAVLVPLVWHDEEWHLLFTRRTDRVESHKGQVSFPGGACDEGETTPEQTALREAQELLSILVQPDMTVASSHVYYRARAADLNARTAITRATGQ